MPRPMTFDKERARALCDEGKTDVEIADMVGATVAAVKSWRRREGLYSPRHTSGGTRPEVTVEVPEGLKPAAREGQGPSPTGEVEQPVTDVGAGSKPARCGQAAQEEPDREQDGRGTDDPVKVEISYRGCIIRVDATAPDQLAEAGKVLAGISVVLERAMGVKKNGA